MGDMARLLVVHHSPTRSTQALLDAALAGARHPDIEGVDVQVVPALEARVEHFLDADATLLGTPANFGYMSGALKHAFDSTYDDVRGRVDGRPFSFWIHGRTDTTGARRAVESITTGLSWRLAAEPVEIVGKPVADADRDRLTELGGTLAALLTA